VRVYDAVQQQQTKWFVFGLSVVFLLVLIQGILQVVAPARAQRIRGINSSMGRFGCCFGRFCFWV